MTFSNLGIYPFRVLPSLYSTLIYSQRIVDVPSLSCAVFGDIPILSGTLFVQYPNSLKTFLGRYRVQVGPI